MMTHLWEAICKAERGCRPLLFLHLFVPIEYLKLKLLLLHLLLVLPKTALKCKCFLLLLLLWVVAVVVTKLRVVVITCNQRSVQQTSNNWPEFEFPSSDKCQLLVCPEKPREPPQNTQTYNIQ